MERGLEGGGNAPITGPFPPPGGHKRKAMERRGENEKMQVGPVSEAKRYGVKDLARTATGRKRALTRRSGSAAFTYRCPARSGRPTL